MEFFIVTDCDITIPFLRRIVSTAANNSQGNIQNKIA